MPNITKLDLSDIVEPSILQAILSVFSAKTGLASAILDENARPIVCELNLSQFCQEIRRTQTGLKRCRESDLSGIQRAKMTGQIEFYVCAHGLVDFCGPIIVGGEIVAYLFGAQFRCACSELVTPNEPILDTLLEEIDPVKEHIEPSSLRERFKKTLFVNDGDELNIIRHQAHEILDQITGILEKLHEWRHAEKVHAFMDKASRVSSVDELLDLTNEHLPGMMQAASSSIFLVQRDETTNREQLVLRKTTFGPLKAKENMVAYEKGEGLTGWTWANCRSLRISNLQNETERSQYDGLVWRRKYDDSDEHTSFLAVPMIGRKGDVIGVIRIPKKLGGVIFNLNDEVFLTFLARHLAWAIECGVLEENWRRALGPNSFCTSAVDLASGLRFDEVLERILKGSLELFGKEGKRHFVNILEKDGDRWRIERMGGELPMQESYPQRVFPKNQGATGRVIRTGREYLSTDPQTAAFHNEYIPIVEESRAASVMAAPIHFGDEMFGAIAIVSDRKYAFDADHDLHMLKNFGTLAGAAILNSRRKDLELELSLKEFSLFARNTLHFLRNKHVRVEQAISVIQKFANTNNLSELQSVAEVLRIQQNQIKKVFDHFKTIGFVFDKTPHTIDLNQLVIEVLDETKDTRVTFAPTKQQLNVLVDAFCIKHVVSELIENALDFIPPTNGHISITTQLIPIADSASECRVIVRDNGPGVLSQLRNAIFSDGFSTRQNESHGGMGLFIAHHMTKVHKGRLWMETPTDGGAQFVLSLPLQA
jgi:ligand-binding sensor protein/signal transduction histidine kinase